MTRILLAVLVGFFRQKEIRTKISWLRSCARGRIYFFLYIIILLFIIYIIYTLYINRVELCWFSGSCMFLIVLEFSKMTKCPFVHLSILSICPYCSAVELFGCGTLLRSTLLVGCCWYECRFFICFALIFGKSAKNIVFFADFFCQFVSNLGGCCFSYAFFCDFLLHRSCIITIN
jgi:hypothetical protein